MSGPDGDGTHRPEVDLVALARAHVADRVAGQAHEMPVEYLASGIPEVLGELGAVQGGRAASFERTEQPRHGVVARVGVDVAMQPRSEIVEKGVGNLALAVELGHGPREPT